MTPAQLIGVLLVGVPVVASSLCGVGGFMEEQADNERDHVERENRDEGRDASQPEPHAVHLSERRRRA